LRAPSAGFFIREGDRFDAADEVGKRRIEQQIFQRVAVRRADELNAALGYGTCGDGFQFTTDLVDHDDLGIVVLDRLDHHFVLECRFTDLHATGAADGRMGNIAVAGDLVRRVDNYDALLLRQDASSLTQHGGFANGRTSDQQDALAAKDNVLNDVDGAVNGAPHTTSQSYDGFVSIANGGDAMQRSFDSAAIICVETADSRDDVIQRLSLNLPVAQFALPVHVTRGGYATKIQDDFKQFVLAVDFFEFLRDLGWQHGQEIINVVGYSFASHFS